MQSPRMRYVAVETLFGTAVDYADNQARKYNENFHFVLSLLAEQYTLRAETCTGPISSEEAKEFRSEMNLIHQKVTQYHQKHNSLFRFVAFLFSRIFHGTQGDTSFYCEQIQEKISALLTREEKAVS